MSCPVSTRHKGSTPQTQPVGHAVVPVLGDEIDHRLPGRSSSASKKIAAAFKNSFARRSSAFSRVTFATSAACTVLTPGRSPPSTSARRTQTRTASGDPICELAGNLTDRRPLRRTIRPGPSLAPWEPWPGPLWRHVHRVHDPAHPQIAGRRLDCRTGPPTRLCPPLGGNFRCRADPLVGSDGVTRRIDRAVGATMVVALRLRIMARLDRHRATATLVRARRRGAVLRLLAAQ